MKGRNSMAFPSKKELARVRRKLAKVEPSRALAPNASSADKLKFELCKQFVIYLREHQMTQKELAAQLDIEPARLNEIVKYRIELFAVDRLLDYLERLRPNLKVTVAWSPFWTGLRCARAGPTTRRSFSISQRWALETPSLFANATWLNSSPMRMEYIRRPNVNGPPVISSRNTAAALLFSLTEIPETHHQHLSFFGSCDFLSRSSGGKKAGYKSWGLGHIEWRNNPKLIWISLF